MNSKKLEQQLIFALEAPRPKRGLEEELVDQELFIYDSATDAVHTLNDGAAIIWHLCDGTRNVYDIAAEIAASFDVPSAQARQEVAEALARFDELGLLAATPGSSA